MRLETVDAQYLDTVALLRGPLVLMALKQEQEGPVPKVTREQLLGAQRVSERQWQLNSTTGPVTMCCRLRQWAAAVCDLFEGGSRRSRCRSGSCD